MSNYWYTLKITHSRKREPETYLLRGINSISEVIPTVLHSLLSQKREDRLNKLLTVSDGDNNDITADVIRDRLPPQYKQYANDLDKLKQEMASLYEISEMYEITDIKLAPSCIGCIYDSPRQRDHMECSSGCLHQKEFCLLCD